MELNEALEELNSNKTSIAHVKRAILIVEIILIAMLGVIGGAMFILFLLNVRESVEIIIPAVLTVLATGVTIFLIVLLYRVASKYLNQVAYELAEVKKYSRTVIANEYDVASPYTSSSIPSSIKYLAILSIVIESIFFIYKIISIMLGLQSPVLLIDIFKIAKYTLTYIGIILVSISGFIFFRGKENDEVRLNTIGSILLTKNNIGIKENNKPEHKRVLILLSLGIFIIGVGMLLPFIAINEASGLLIISLVSDLLFFIVLAGLGIYLELSYIALDRKIAMAIYNLALIINELPESLYLDITHNTFLVS